MKLGVITAYFNPVEFVTRRANYNLFAAGLAESNVDLLTIECVSLGRKAELSDSGFGQVITVRADDILWHKERLLNLAIQHLPEQVEAVVWVDSDVLFENKSWPAEVAHLLERYHVVQLFSSMTHLPPKTTKPNSNAHWLPSYGAKLASSSSTIATRFAEHGHTGFGWAIRKSSIEGVGLFDVCVAGGADHLMAHAFSGNWHVPCVDRLLGRQSPLRKQFDEWSERLNRAIDGRIGVCQGRLMHLWHGSLKQRCYFERNRQLLKIGFDPKRDLARDSEGCWRWTDRNSSTAKFLTSYMSERQEDG